VILSHAKSAARRITSVQPDLRDFQNQLRLGLEALLRIDVKTIYTYAQKGLIPCVRIQSNLRFNRKKIFDWIDQQSFQPFSTNRQRSAMSSDKEFSPV